MRRLVRSVATLAVVVALLPAGSAVTAPVTATRIDPFRHLGTWVDVFDFTPELAVNGRPKLGPDSVDRMAAAGIRTLYIQAATALRAARSSAGAGTAAGGPAGGPARPPPTPRPAPCPRRFRAATRRPLAAIVLSPVHLEVVNPAYWPNFPWRAIAPSYDAWLPMTYWTERTTKSGYREAAPYGDETVRRLRADGGAPRAPPHVLG